MSTYASIGGAVVRFTNAAERFQWIAAHGGQIIKATEIRRRPVFGADGSLVKTNSYENLFNFLLEN